MRHWEQYFCVTNISFLFSSRHSLRESFSGLDATLKFPVGELFIVEAVHPYNPEASSPASQAEKNLLPLSVGERVTVVDKSAESQGWWKAVAGGFRIGYIPKSFVTPVVEERLVTSNLWLRFKKPNIARDWNIEVRYESIMFARNLSRFILSDFFMAFQLGFLFQIACEP